MNEFKSKKNPLVWLSLFPLFQPKDFPQFETSVSTCIFAMFILNGFEHSRRLFEACHRCHPCRYQRFESTVGNMNIHIGYVLPDSIADSDASAASSGGKWELT